MNTRTATTVMLAAASASAIAIALLLGAGRTSQQYAPPAVAPAAITQYGLLLRTISNEHLSSSQPAWTFFDSQNAYDDKAMADLFRLRPGDELNKARVITIIASQAWELVSYTDSQVHEPAAMRDGTAFGSGTTKRTEQWWFRKR